MHRTYINPQESRRTPDIPINTFNSLQSATLMTKPKSKGVISKSSARAAISDTGDDIDLDHDQDSGTGGDASANGSRSIIDYSSPCIFHIYFEKCTQEDCKFSHSIKSIASRPPSRSSSPTSDSFPRGPRESHSNRQICRRFLSGTCTYGNKCRFSHEKTTKSNGGGASRDRRDGGGDWRDGGKPHSGRPNKNQKAAPAIRGVQVNLNIEETATAHIEEIFSRYDTAKEDVNQPRPPNLEYVTPPISKVSPSPPLESDSGVDAHNEDEDSHHTNDDQQASVYDDGADIDIDVGEQLQLDSEIPADNPVDDTQENVERDDLDTGEPVDDGDVSEDRWGWHGPPQRQRENEEEEKANENNEPEHASHTGGTVEEEPGEAEIDDAWYQPLEAEDELEEEVEQDQAVDEMREEGGEQDHAIGEANEEVDEQNHAVGEVNEEVGEQNHAIDEMNEEMDEQDHAIDEMAEGVEDQVHMGDDKKDEVESQDHIDDAWDQATEQADERDESNHDQSPEPVPIPVSRPPPIQNQPSTRSTPSRNTPSSLRSTPILPSPTVSAPTRAPIPPPPAARPAVAPPLPAVVTPSPPAVVAPPPPAPLPPSAARQVSLLSLHWSRFADPGADPALAFCKAFAQNKCSNASFDACRFRHCLTPYEYTLLFKDPQPLPISLEKRLIRNDSPENTTPITSPSITLHWSHFADPTCDANIAFCKSYAEHMCPYGDTGCYFRHCLTIEEYTLLFKDPQPNLITPGGIQPQLQQQQQRALPQPISLPPPNLGASKPQPHSQPNTRHILCAFFTKGKCKNGDNCNFSHDASQQPAPPPKIPCVYWPRGRCNNGDQCPFAHIGESGAITQGGQNDNGAWRNDAQGNQDQEQGEWAVNGDENNGGDTKNWDNQGEGAQKQEGEGEADVADDWGGQNQGTGWGDSGATAAAGGWDSWNNDASGWETKNDGANSGRDDKAGTNNSRDNGNAWNGGRDNGNAQNNSWSDNWRNRNSRNDDRSNASRGNGVCFVYQREGRCPRGSGCRFSHDVQTGRSSGHGSRDASRQNRMRTESPFVTPAPPRLPASSPTPADKPATPPTIAHRTSSTYGGRHVYDPESIGRWGQEVAVSFAGSDAGGSHAGGRGIGSHRSSHGSSANNESRNRSVDHPPTGNGTCQFHLVGRCSNGDTCPSPHDPAVAATGSDAVVDDEAQEVEEQKLVSWEASGGVAEANEEMADRRREDSEGVDDAEVEDIAANDDDTNANQHHVVDSKWGLDDQWDVKPIEVPEEEIRINKPCLHYGQGYCEAGRFCRFLHIDPPEASPERSIQEPIPQGEENRQEEDQAASAGTRDHISENEPLGAEADYGHPLVEKSILGCAVIFGRDCLPEKVITGTDSSTLLLEGPPDITEARVHDAVNKYGPIEDILITRGQPDADEAEVGREGEQEAPEATPLEKSIIRVEFKDMRDAATAAKDMMAALADAIAIEPASTTSTWVKFRWPQATRAAWVYYSTVTKAKTMAEKLHHTMFQDRKINASFLRPDKRSKDLFAIKLERLPTSTAREDLKDIVQDAKLVTMSELTYADDAREILRRLEGIKAFVEVPDVPSKINAVAYAQFSSESCMLAALQMHGTKHKFLGKQELVVQHIWFAQYTLPIGAFKVVSAELAGLHIQCEGRASVESSDFGDHAIIYLNAPHEEITTFANTNLFLHAICRGMIIMNAEGRPEWDEYFYSTSSTKVIENINSKNDFYVFLNTSARRIHVVGSGLDQDKGVSTIKKLLQKVRGSYQEHPIHRNAIRQLVNGGLSVIQGDVGVNRLSLDVFRSILVVRGGDKALMEAIRHVLDFVPPPEDRNRSEHSSLLCSICELRPSSGDSNPFLKLPCGHVYCTTCLQHALVYATQDHSAPIRCIGRVQNDEGGDTIPCDQPITYTTIRDLLPLLVEPEYLRMAFISFVLSHPDEYFFCSSLRCDAVHRRGARGDTARCSICRAWNCLFCGTMIHDGVGCEEAQKIARTIRN
ncbi:hypothetical protein P691DRAFT_694540 [Macrolepiota fuliginosa MF-IS2]|uniref:RING-type E3 ubiquitin transferase n=1 Tax=Macrolepiota fuliginosa MF-IS2 TaxID=1400762 RepID=A0A9P5XPW7_9AGAR|nr:hypothetical protein P691DRAFT_694540 [Macrolepiota fuliginosa MF-IS2]